ncbi:MAG: hypothetical protein Q8J68_08905 [Methanolobus sp.]|uniref:hypothetical protein n=1 Tax=Methanolobus sp. TaxID=1874737 RepID=UPI00272F0B80|nr:hypothetical protein [Methanolobus sp.]MDP2217391.1 hypothetical protein [Methanolobus sp.]
MKNGENLYRLVLTLFVLSFLFKIKYTLFDVDNVTESFAYSPLYFWMDVTNALTVSTLGNIIFSLVGIQLIAKTFTNKSQNGINSQKENVLLFANIAFVIMILFAAVLVIEQILL